MSRQGIVIVSSLVIFVVGIFLMGISNVSKNEPIPYKSPLVEPLEGSRINDMWINIYESGTCGLNLTGSFQGYEDQSIFIIRDSEGHIVYSSPSFPAPSDIIEFDINEPGWYSIEFNIIVTDDSCVELYQYKYQIGPIRPYVHLYYVGAPLAISGIIGVIAGLFVLSGQEE